MQEACLNSLKVFASHIENWYPTTEMLVLWQHYPLFMEKYCSTWLTVLFQNTHRTADAV